MAAGYTEIKYNDVVLQECLTKEFHQEPVWDTDGQTLLYHKFTVTVQGYFVSGIDTVSNGGTPPVYTPVPSATVEIESVPRTDDTTAGGRYYELADSITARRKTFIMTVGKGGVAEQIILQAYPAVGGPAAPGQAQGEGVADKVLDINSSLYEYYDRNGGPRVRNLKIDELVANETFRVNVTFEVCIRPPIEYLSGGPMAQVQRAYGVLSNRWSCVDTIDQHRFTTRMYQGQITLSSPFMSPHEFRYLALPPIEPGMQRRHIEFAAQADGLKLRYSIRDEESTVTPIGTGKPGEDSVHMAVTQDENVAQFATHVITNFTITLSGGPNANRKMLLRMAAVYADAKLALSTFVKPLAAGEDVRKRAVFIESYRMSEEYDSLKTNKVRLSIQIRRNPDKFDMKNGTLVKHVTENFGNEVDGPQLAAATTDPALATALNDYNPLLSWGNRTFPTSYLDDETPPIEGTIAAGAALACHLQSVNTTDFSMCSGMPANEDRIEQLRKSRNCTEPAAVTGGIRRTIADLEAEALSPTHKENVYERQKLESEYREIDLVAPLPVAREADPFSYGSGGTGESPSQNPVPNQAINDSTRQTRFIQLAPPQVTRIVRIEAKRWGAAPRLPDPMTSFTDKDGVGHSLLKKHVNVPAPQLNGNHDTRVFVVHAEYVYALSHSPKQYLTGVPDFESGEIDGVEQFVIPVKDLYSADNGVDYQA